MDYPSHACPVTGCGQRVPYAKLMCHADWALVPKIIQRAVYSAWNHGRGAGTPEHVAAISAAIAVANAARSQ